jgi:hypothetical protein
MVADVVWKRGGAAAAVADWRSYRRSGRGRRIDVQRAGPVRPWPARAGPGQPAAGRAGPDHTGLRAATSAHGPVRGPF